MAIDPSIILGVKPLQLPQNDPLETFGKSLSLKALMGQNDLQGLQMQQARQGIDDDTAVRDAYRQSGGDSATLRKLLTGGGQFKAIQALDKFELEKREKEGSIGKTTIETANLKAKAARDGLAGVTDQSGYTAWLQTAKDLVPGVAANAPPIFDPKWQRSAVMDADKFIADTASKMNAVSLGGKSALIETNRNAPGFDPNVDLVHTQTPDSVASIAAQAKQGELNRAVTVAGQDKADARARDALAAGKAPTGYRFKADGKTLEVIPGGPAEKDKALTETQGKATAFSMRMADANTVIDPLEKDGKFNPAAITTQYAGRSGLEAPLNYMASDKSQKYEQAKRNWVTANLRLESGAAIPDPELQQEYKKWFPIPGDGPGVIAQKASARKIAEQAMTVQAGPGTKKIPAAAPKLGDSPQGIRFLGMEG